MPWGHPELRVHSWRGKLRVGQFGGWNFSPTHSVQLCFICSYRDVHIKVSWRKSSVKEKKMETSWHAPQVLELEAWILV